MNGGIRMTAREYLSQIKVLAIKIETMQEQCERLKSKASSIKAVSYDKKEGTSGHSGYITEQVIIDYIVLEQEIEQQKLVYEKQRQMIIDKIMQLNDERYIQVLKKRYVEDKGFNKIAKEMTYSYDRIIHLHQEALGLFEVMTMFER